MTTDAPFGSLILLNPADNVAVAGRHLPADARVKANDSEVTLSDPITQAHKVAITRIAKGEPIVKYGNTIGFASAPIEPGQHVHTHNVSCDQFTRDYEFCTKVTPVPEPDETQYFDGYTRADGRAGTRNYIVLVSSVNCSATVCDKIVSHFTGDVLRPYPNVDGVFAVSHKGGCGMAPGGLDGANLKRVADGFCSHPNVSDFLIIGLGCETNQAGELIPPERLLGRDTEPKVLIIQTEGGIARTVERGIELVGKMIVRANTCKRTRQPASKITVALQCGGSDGNSGITANPALGVASDILVAQGGTSILAETTELYGAEHLLTRRAVTRDVGEKLLERIKWWEAYADMFGETINNNPSTGNKAGGLTTIYEKSLGAVAKSGNSPFAQMYQYAQRVDTSGMVVMDSPGFDPVSVTGQVAGGANIVVFTTGRGSAFGCKPAPCIKVATNTRLFEHMNDDMDIDAGKILTGTPVETVGREIFDMILRVAGGEASKSAAQGVGDEEFAPWLIGPVF
ncbi:MAG: galactonate dehydratase [Phycisphaerae bacterium]|nr:galactonate dehydratase [Phycisphaerae bacterium]